MHGLYFRLTRFGVPDILRCRNGLPYSVICLKVLDLLSRSRKLGPWWWLTTFLPSSLTILVCLLLPNVYILCYENMKIRLKVGLFERLGTWFFSITKLLRPEYNENSFNYCYNVITTMNKTVSSQIAEKWNILVVDY